MTNHNPKNVLMMAAGTGGHVFPALAVAKVLTQQGVNIHWLGTPQGLEGALVNKQGYPFHSIAMQGLRGNGLWRAIKMPVMLSSATLQAKRLIQQHNIDVAVGFGGYVTVPGGLAARWCGIPLAIHEQNAVAGMSNRQLARFSQVIMQGFEGVFTGERVLTVGNPVRDDIVAIHKSYASDDNTPLNMLVVGGSLGAQAINETIPQLLRHQTDIQVRHQCGARHLEQTKRWYAEAGIDPDRFELMAFIDDMAAAYAWADVVLCRAGALTVSEVAAAGVAAIFVPLPSAVDDHQTMNARYLSDQGAALLLAQDELTKLPELIAHLRRGQCQAMAKRAKTLAQTKATEQAAEAIMALTQHLKSS